MKRSTPRPRARRGIALFITLLVTVLFSILMSSMVVTSSQNLLLLGSYRDRVGALKMAEAGATHLLYNLSRNIYDRGDLKSSDYLEAGSTYSVTFDATKPYYSVNQLGMFTGVRTTDCVGATVPYDTADLVITGIMNASVRRIRLIVRRGTATPYALASLGRVNLQGNCSVSGIQDLATGAPLPGVIHSNHVSTSNTDFAIQWDGTGAFNLNPTGYLSCVGGNNPNPISSSLTSTLSQGQVRTSAPSVQVPRIDITAAVGQHTSNPAPRVDSSSGGVSSASGQIRVTQDTYLNGSYHLDGDVNLQGGALYVNGDLTVNGAVRGVGAVYVTGSTTVRGDSAVTTNQDNSAALYSKGDVNLTGLDATTYLNSLATTNPSTVGTALTNLQNELGNFKSRIDTLNQNPQAMTYSDLLGLWQSEEKLGGRGGAALNWAGPHVSLLRPSPNGGYSQASSTSYVMALRLALEKLPSYGTDVRAQKIVTALDGLNYFFRDSYIGGNSWDDDSLPMNQQTLDHLFRLDPLDTSGTTFVPAKKAGAGVQYVRSCAAFLAQNPTDLSWVGRSKFQGVVYSDGNINASNNFDIIGLVMNRGDINLTGGSSLIYDQEYSKLVVGREAPLNVISWQEL